MPPSPLYASRSFKTIACCLTPAYIFKLCMHKGLSFNLKNKLNMTITIQNITTTSAIVSWPSSPGCVDTFYSVMYHPNWNSLLMGYTRKSFLREDRVPVSQTSTSLGNLSPQTTYILCVTCQSANPTREQCQVFSTLDEGTELGESGRELAMGVWLASSILLLIIAVALLWGCLHTMCPAKRDPERGSQSGSNPPHLALTPMGGNMGSEGRKSLYTPGFGGEDSQNATVIENPFRAEHSREMANGQGREL
ncbi:fibronectin type III domain-containing protein 9 isoform X1 [Onychostoma macrolepis]|uniref:fibronectin type III domain-containing protein 9 isoform X1 n=2 Tax=Onychostoma macrolepis TaxID=369639 RepID=UPI00272A1E82|nr:fibronectin type III domain-containing protein 9 isoform X1 [Onychostoma macrolepis]